MNITFIGLGIMGSRMAANLLAEDYSITVHNRTKFKADTLVERGATWADSPALAAKDCDILFTVLSEPGTVRDAALGIHGFLQNMKPGSLWIDSSTTNPAFAREMKAIAQEKGVRFMDAPVGGSKDAAQDGELTFIAGGNPDDLKEVQPLFGIMGRYTMHVGDTGMGISMKLVLNHLLATSMVGFAEGLALGTSLGISKEFLLENLPKSPVTAGFVRGKVGKVASGDYDPDFPLRWMQKDLHMASLAAYEADTPMPLSNAAKEIYRLAIRDGYGDMDFSAICELLLKNHETK
ncbi:MAG: 6-phosphogluconate dehydrogenase [Ectothiorhodospiraceae bacterium]|nr:6-phosphogluconate dehydrogenase [Ectothiorhodospiraceae bacterium]